MHLQQIRKNIFDNKYELRRQFLEDLTQIYVNSYTYNGAEHLITKSAKEVFIITQNFKIKNLDYRRCFKMSL